MAGLQTTNSALRTSITNQINAKQTEKNSLNEKITGAGNLVQLYSEIITRLRVLESDFIAEQKGLSTLEINKNEWTGKTAREVERDFEQVNHESSIVIWHISSQISYVEEEKMRQERAVLSFGEQINTLDNQITGLRNRLSDL